MSLAAEPHLPGGRAQSRGVVTFLCVAVSSSGSAFPPGRQYCDVPAELRSTVGGTRVCATGGRGFVWEGVVCGRLGLTVPGVFLWRAEHLTGRMA